MLFFERQKLWERFHSLTFTTAATAAMESTP